MFGQYSIQSATGQCGDLDTSAPQSIEGGVQFCALHFVSVAAGGAGAVNGGADLGADGTFSGATLYFGSAQRSPCNGAWNEANKTMTVSCGGPSDQCTVVMKWTGP